MQYRTKQLKSGLFTAIFVLVGWSVGCTDDLYAPCDLDPNSPDRAVAQCGQNDESSKSCVVDNQIQCETRSCGRFEGSDPFCTQKCASDGDCPAGKCLEFVFQTGERHCVENALVNR